MMGERITCATVWSLPIGSFERHFRAQSVVAAQRSR